MGKTQGSVPLSVVKMCLQFSLQLKHICLELLNEKNKQNFKVHKTENGWQYLINVDIELVNSTQR